MNARVSTLEVFRSKRVMAVAVAALASLSLYQAMVFFGGRNELTDLAAESLRLQSALDDIRREQSALTNRLRTAPMATPAPLSPTSPASEIETTIAAWLARVARLKQLARERPEFDFPEIGALVEKDWFAAARDVKFEDDSELKKTFGDLRNTARKSLARLLHSALSGYASAHEDQLPASMDQVAQLIERPLPPALFSRFEVKQSGAHGAAGRDEPLLAERLTVLSGLDNRIVVTNTNAEVEDLTSVSDREFRQALRGFVVSNQGRLPSEASQLVSFFKNSPRDAALRSFLEKPKSDFAADALSKLLPLE